MEIRAILVLFLIIFELKLFTRTRSAAKNFSIVMHHELWCCKSLQNNLMNTH